MQPAQKHVKAAQYVRMSTDLQKYSTANQKEAIAGYASLHGFEVIRTYADEGRSGLNLKGRSALQQLLADVLSDKPGFNAILVYDVSRWGRFQDADESAHYEFLCRNAGVPIHYCAEPFSNDGSLSAAIMKSLKRVMAGEYSRELSEKVYAGQVRLAKQGFQMGGPHRYGYRRMLLDEAGKPKGILLPGQQKNLRTDRVILVPGPAHEVAIVRRIFRLCALWGMSVRKIAALLNSEGAKTAMGNDWTGTAVSQVLRSETYIGIGVYGRYSKKLGTRPKPNDCADWIRHEGTIEPLIDFKTFRAAQQAKKKRMGRLSDDELLAKLRNLYIRKGRLTEALIKEEPGYPNWETFHRRFGGLKRAFSLVGYKRPVLPYASINPGLHHSAMRLLEHAGDLIIASGGRADWSPSERLLIVDGNVVVGATMVRARKSGTSDKWRVHYKLGFDLDFMLAGLLKGGNNEIIGYALLPRSRFGGDGSIYISEAVDRRENGRFDRLSDVYGLILQAQRPAA